jgi:hypothetical protein
MKISINPMNAPPIIAINVPKPGIIEPKSANANSKSSINPPVTPEDKLRKEKEIQAIGIKQSIPKQPEHITRPNPMIYHLKN